MFMCVFVCFLLNINTITASQAQRPGRRLVRRAEAVSDSSDEDEDTNVNEGKETVPNVHSSMRVSDTEQDEESRGATKRAGGDGIHTLPPPL